VDEGEAFAQRGAKAAIADRRAALDASRSNIALDGGEFERQAPDR
jgi:hypothetical protein